ncbi:MAG: gluconokinase, partial [Pseudomonadota bacterium]
APMFEGDDYHPASNREKMAAGEALTDKDRASWLDALLEAIIHEMAPVAVLACSALTPYVQQRLRGCASHCVQFVLLEASREVLAERMQSRADHFMPLSLLDSQIEALSPPSDAIRIDARETVERIVAQITARLNE